MKMRMQALSDALVLTTSGGTRLVDRIEKAGLVRREPVPEDRRGCDAILTDAGKELMERAQVFHRVGIETHFAEHLSAREQQTLFKIMSKLLVGNS